jgi:endoglucanase
MARKIHRWFDNNQSTDTSDSSSPTTTFVQLLNQLNTHQTHVTSAHHTAGSSSQTVNPAAPATVDTASVVTQAADVNHPATLNFYSSTSKGFVAGAIADVKLDDPDGISGPVTYHWKSIGPFDKQWTDMPWVTTDRITLTPADAGKLFDVTATFIDDKGHAEAPEHMFKDSDPVTAPPPSPTPPPPTTSDVNHPATLNFYSSTSKGFVAGALADVKLDDPDGISGPVTYHWKFKGPNDSNWTDMPQVTGDAIILTPADAGKFFDVTATFIDDKGHAEAPEHMFKDSDPVTAPPTPTPTPAPAPTPPPDVDHLGTIDVTSLPTGFAVGATVTAHVADSDGLGSGAINYHWFTVGSGNQLTPIAGATGQSYTLQQADAGKDIEVSATYTDAKNHTATINDTPFHVADAPSSPPPPTPTPDPTPTPSPGSGHVMMGINLAGAEFGSAVPGTLGKDYTYPTHQEIDYYAGKGMEVIRLPFLWERVQHSPNATLDANELKQMDDVVDYAKSKGLMVDLDMHNYGKGFGGLIGSGTSNAAFADVWSKLASHFAGDSNVIFGLMNEPNQQSATQWLTSVNAAIDAIRHTGAGQEILVPGSYWDGAWTWVSSDNDTVIGKGVQDPLHNFAFEVHQYLDSDGSGTHNNVVSATVGVTRLQEVTQWAESTGNKLFLGEFGVASDQTSITALNNMLDFIDQHPAAWQAATYWAGGPWWGNYAFSAEPTSLTNPVDKPQMTALINHIEPQDHMPTA